MNGHIKGPGGILNTDHCGLITVGGERVPIAVSARGRGGRGAEKQGFRKGVSAPAQRMRGRRAGKRHLGPRKVLT